MSIDRIRRIPDANGVWYEITCRCSECRDYGICENVVSFIRAAPKHWRFELTRSAERARVAAPVPPGADDEC